MKSIKKMMTAAMMMAILTVGTSFAQKGLLVSDFAGTTKQDTCKQEISKDRKGVILQDFTGVLVNGFTGVLVNGFTGVLVNGFTGVLVNGAVGTPVNCGVLVNG